MATIEIDELLDATCERVHRAFTDAQQLESWFWPPAMEPKATVEPREGGAWRISSKPYDMGVSGTFTEFKPDLLAWSWQWDGESEEPSIVVVTLVAEGEGTRLRVRHDVLTPAAASAHAEGWESCLERLPHFLATAE